ASRTPMARLPAPAGGLADQRGRAALRGGLGAAPGAARLVARACRAGGAGDSALCTLAARPLAGLWADRVGRRRASAMAAPGRDDGRARHPSTALRPPVRGDPGAALPGPWLAWHAASVALLRLADGVGNDTARIRCR